MALGLLGVRLLLAAVFAAAAAGKLRDRIGFRKALAAFGVPAAAVAPVAGLIPPMELAVAALLVPAASASWGALAATLLLAVFTTALAINLARGRLPECACFGTAVAEPIGPATLVRNLALLAGAALIVAAGPGASLGAAPDHWRAASDDERLLASMALVLLAALVATHRRAVRLHAANARLTSRLDVLEQRLRADAAPSPGVAGLPRGAPAPPFELPRLEGDRTSLESLRQAGLPILLVFSDSHCPACAQLWPDIGRWQRQHAGTLTIAAICGGSPQLLEMRIAGTNVINALLQGDTRLADAYGLPRTPSAVIVSPDGLIDSGAATGLAAIRELVAQRTADAAIVNRE